MHVPVSWETLSKSLLRDVISLFQMGNSHRSETEKDQQDLWVPNAWDKQRIVASFMSSREVFQRHLHNYCYKQNAVLHSPFVLFSKAVFRYKLQLLESFGLLMAQKGISDSKGGRPFPLIHPLRNTTFQGVQWTAAGGDSIQNHTLQVPLPL